MDLLIKKHQGMHGVGREEQQIGAGAIVYCCLKRRDRYISARISPTADISQGLLQRLEPTQEKRGERPPALVILLASLAPG